VKRLFENSQGPLPLPNKSSNLIGGRYINVNQLKQSQTSRPNSYHDADNLAPNQINISSQKHERYHQNRRSSSPTRYQSPPRRYEDQNRRSSSPPRRFEDQDQNRRRFNPPHQMIPQNPPHQDQIELHDLPPKPPQTHDSKPMIVGVQYTQHPNHAPVTSLASPTPVATQPDSDSDNYVPSVVARSYQQFTHQHQTPPSGLPRHPYDPVDEDSSDGVDVDTVPTPPLQDLSSRLLASRYDVITSLT